MFLKVVSLREINPKIIEVEIESWQGRGTFIISRKNFNKYTCKLEVITPVYRFDKDIFLLMRETALKAAKGYFQEKIEKKDKWLERDDLD